MIPACRGQKYVVGYEIFDMENNGRRKSDLRKALGRAGSWGSGSTVDRSGEPLHCFDEWVSAISVHVLYIKHY